MKSWKRVNRCHYCGGELEISDHYVFSRDYRITKSGVLSKKFKLSDPGPMDCTTGYCFGCGKAFDSDSITVENDGTVWIKVDGED